MKSQADYEIEYATRSGHDALANARATLERALAEPDTQARMQRISAMPAWGSPAELMRGVDNDFRFYGELLPAIGLKAED